MFKLFQKKEKPRVFLGTLTVLPRSDIKRHLENWGVLNDDDMDAGLKKNLKEIFTLPLAKEVENPATNDLVVDVVIPKFQSGELWDLTLDGVGIPLFWRPKVTVSSRLYYLKTKKTKSTFSVTEKMGFGHYFGLLFSFSRIFRPKINSSDMEVLLYQACHKLLLKMQKSI